MEQQGHSNASDSYALEMAPLTNELRGRLATLNSFRAQLGDMSPAHERRSTHIIIAKVRHLTRNVDSSEYGPDYVSIGPYHYPRLESRNLHLGLEHDKVASLGKVLSAAKPGMTLEVYVKEMARLELKARSCYANTFDDLTSEQFVRMLLFDGCYILSRLINLQVLAPPTNGADGANIQSSSVSTATVANIPPSVSTASGANTIEDLEVVRDVFYLAENQIPFFVLEKISELTYLDGGSRAIQEITKYAVDLMRTQKYTRAASAMVPSEPTVPLPGNLLHLLHMHLKHGVSLPASGNGLVSVGRWRTATQYNLAGVKFKSQVMSEDGDVHCILDVKLDSGGGTLEVPCLDIDSETWRLLRNLMELEQRNGNTIGTPVTAYCVFISQVACTAKDVELLSRKGVIVHGHGNDGEVAQCFADLCKGIVFNPNDTTSNYLWEACHKLDKRFQSYPRRWMAWLRRKYFSNPWLAVGLLAAAVGLVCAIVQAVYCVLSYELQGWN